MRSSTGCASEGGPIRPRQKVGRRIRQLGAVAVVVLGSVHAAGCFPLPDMASSQAVHPQEETMTPPEGALAVAAPRVIDRREARTSLTNPRPASSEVLTEGAELYRIYCVMCHGATGSGDGEVAQYFRRVPDLNAPYIQNYTDGRLYTVLREGGFNMPRYAEALSVDERWAVVHYVRSFTSKP